MPSAEDRRPDEHTAPWSALACDRVSGPPSAGSRRPSRPPRQAHDGDGGFAHPPMPQPDYGDILLGRSCKIPPNAPAWDERCGALRRFPEQAFATVKGMICLADDHSGERTDALCAEALELNRFGWGFLRDRVRTATPPARPRAQTRDTIPGDANIRGGACYSNDEATR